MKKKYEKKIIFPPIAFIIIFTISSAFTGCQTATSSASANSSDTAAIDSSVTASSATASLSHADEPADVIVSSTPSPTPELPADAIDDISPEKLEQMLPIFDTVVLSSIRYKEDGSLNYWDSVLVSAINFVRPDQNYIQYYPDDEGSPEHTRFPYNSEGVSYTSDFSHLLVPGLIIREFAAAMFPSDTVVPEFPDYENSEHNFSYYDAEQDCYHIAPSDHSLGRIKIETYTPDTDGSYLLTFSVYVWGTGEIQPLRTKVRIVKNLSHSDGTEPLFPYTVKDVIEE